MVRSKTWNIIPEGGYNRSVNHRNLISPSLNISDSMGLIKNIEMGILGTGGSIPVEGDNASRIDAILDNYIMPSILTGANALQYPADPVTTGEPYEVRTNAELTAAVSGDGRLVRIFGPANGGQASYAQFSLNNRTDIDIVMDNDATITTAGGWAWALPVRRIRWTGGNIHINSDSGAGYGFRIYDVEDFLLDNVRMYSSITAGIMAGVFYPGAVRHRRFAVINSTIEQSAGVLRGAYAVYSASDPTLSEDWIYINNRLLGQGAPFRMQDLGTRLCFIGNYLAGSPGVSDAPVRFHLNMDKLWFRDNVVNGTGNQPALVFQVADDGYPKDSSIVMNQFLIENNRLFVTQSDLSGGVAWRFGDVEPSNQAQATNWEMYGNRWIDPTGPTVGEAMTGGLNITVPYIASNNLRVGPGHLDYEASPPAATNYGADH